MTARAPSATVRAIAHHRSEVVTPVYRLTARGPVRPGQRLPDTRTGRHRDPSRAWRYTPEGRRWARTVVKRDGACVECGHPGSEANPLTADHVVPVARGGARYDLDNGRCLCRSCNSAKGAG